MSSPFVGIAVFAVLCTGLVLLWQGFTSNERDLNRFGNTVLNVLGYGGVDRWEESSAHDEASRRHPAESHPRRLMAIGSALILVAVGVSVLLAMQGT